MTGISVKFARIAFWKGELSRTFAVFQPAQRLLQRLLTDFRNKSVLHRNGARATLIRLRVAALLFDRAPFFRFEPDPLNRVIETGGDSDTQRTTVKANWERSLPLPWALCFRLSFDEGSMKGPVE